MGASFTPVHDWIYCNSDAELQHAGAEPNYLSDRHDEFGATSNSTHSGPSVLTVADGQLQAESFTSVDFSIVTDGGVFSNNKLVVTGRSQSEVSITTDLGIKAYAWNGGAPVAPGTATGNFYRIDPEGTEAAGDLVTVVFDFSAVLSAQLVGGSSYSTIVSGGWSGNDLLITLNCADYDDPQPSEIIHTVSRKDLLGSYADQYEFQAVIGDVIGLHFGVESTAFTGTNPGSASSSVSLDMSLTLTEGFDPSKADFDKSGRVDLVDLAYFARAWLWTEPVNDTCENAEAIALDTHYTGTTNGMTDDSVWYSFTPTVSDFYTVSICDGSGDYLLLIFDECGGGEPIIGTYEDCEFVVWMNAGEDYFMEIIGYEEVESDYDLIVTQGAEAPSNDDCMSAESVSEYDYPEGTTIGAAGSDESNCGSSDTHDVWYLLTPDNTGQYVLVLHPTYGPFAGVLTLYEGVTCPPMLPQEIDCQVAESYGSAEIYAELTSGQTYLIRVASDDVGTGPFGLEFMFEGGEE